MLKPFAKFGFLGGLFVITALLVALVSYGIYRSVLQFVDEGYLSSLKNETDSFELALQHSLMIQDQEMVANLVQDLSIQPTVDTIRLLNSEGEVVASSIAAESGVRLDPQGRNCSICHDANPAALPTTLKFTSPDDNQQHILVANSLNNRVVCQSCHSQEQETLGVILAEYHGSTLALWRRNLALAITAGGGLIWLALFAGFGFFSYRSMVRPLQRLANGKDQTELQQREDDLGEIARQMVALQRDLDEQQQLAAAQRVHLNALMSLSASIDDTVTIESVFRRAMGTLQEVTGFSSIAMRYFDAQEQSFRLVYQNGMTPRMVQELASIPASVGYHAELVRTLRAVRSTDLPHDPRRPSDAPLEVGYQSLISVPFLCGDRMMGSMELASREPQAWPDEQVRWLELVGRVIGNILYHIELTERLRGAAIMQERSYIAREIHDGLVQLLGSLRLWAENALLAIEGGDYDEVQGMVRKIEANARDAYSSLREEMMGLRDTFSPEEGITPVVREYLQRYQRQWGIETHLEVDRSLEAGGARFDPSTVEIQLLRIIQEALTNVRRHAQASRVQVRLSRRENWFRVEITDNGTGFELDNISEEKLGLRIMRERAANVHGKLEIETAPETGTRLCIDVPLAQPPAA